MPPTWKPLDVRGLRLYRVDVQFPDGRTDVEIVASTAPRKAQQAVESKYSHLNGVSYYGQALKVMQPGYWWHDTRESGIPSPHDCKHVGFFMISSGYWTGVEHSGRQDISVCAECGVIRVFREDDGEHFRVEFTIDSEHALMAAAKGFARCHGGDWPVVQELAKTKELVERIARIFSRVSNYKASVEAHRGTGDPQYVFGIDCTDFCELEQLINDLVGIGNAEIREGEG